MQHDQNSAAIAVNPITWLDSALEYVADGCAVVPLYGIHGGQCACGKPDCKSPGKHPVTLRGVSEASADPDQVRAWAEAGAEFPHVNLGVALPDGVAVIDVDPRNGGASSLGELESRFGNLPTDRYAVTGGNGLHVWVRVPAGHVLPGKLAPGVDVKQRGGYVLGVGSSHASGGIYAWESKGTLPSCPGWIEQRKRGEITERPEIPGVDVPAAEIEALAERVATYCVDGQKHHLCWELGSWLDGRGWSGDSIEQLIRLLPVKDVGARVRDALDGAGCAGGWSRLKERFGSEAETIDRSTPNPALDRRKADQEHTTAIIAKATAELATQYGFDPGALVQPVSQPANDTEPSLAELRAQLREAQAKKADAEQRKQLADWEQHRQAAEDVEATKRDIAELRAKIIRAEAVAARAKLVSTPAVAPTIGAVKLTDAGMAEAVADAWAWGLRYCDAKRKWLVWDGRRWSWDNGEATAKQLVVTLARKLQTDAASIEDLEQRKKVFGNVVAYEAASKVAAVLAMLVTIPTIRVRVGDLDADPSRLSCGNGVLDLSTGCLEPHDPALLMTRCTGVDFVPDARSGLWERYLDDLTGGDLSLRGYLQRAAGSSLWGYPLEKVFFFLWGVPDSGKSRFLDALSAALGTYAATASFDTWLQRAQVGGNRGDLVDLAGARVVVSSEVRPNAKLDAELVKAVTGGDKLKAAAKYEHDQEIRPTFTLWWAANDRPRVRADDSGFWGRAQVLGCQTPVPKERQDRYLAMRFAEPEHAQAILAWLVEGCVAWQRDGLGSCAAVETENRAYRDSQDPTSEFWSDCVAQGGAGDFVSRTQLWSAWQIWTAENGGDGADWVKQRELYAKAAERFSTKEHKRDGVRGFLGLRLVSPCAA